MNTFAILVIVFITFNGSVTPITSYLRRALVTHSQQPSEIIKRDGFRKRILNNDDYSGDDGDDGDDDDTDAYYDSKSMHFNYDYYHSSEGYSTFTINDSNQFDVTDDYHYWQWWVWIIVVIFGVAALWCFSKCCLCR